MIASVAKRTYVQTLSCLIFIFSAMGTFAADYPNRPVTLVVGYSAGGGVDTIARIVAEKLPQRIGQPVVDENRPGVASIVGATYVAKAKPDGHILLMGASGPIVFNHALDSKLPYGPQDLIPISLVGVAPLMLLVNTNSPFKSLQDLVNYSKQNPSKSNYSASSSSFQLITELFNRKTGARFTHIPYKGANDSVTAVMAGDVTMTLADTGPATVGLKSGRVRALAVTSAERLKDYPDVPTLTELGVDLKASLWIGLLAPAGTPNEVVKQLANEIAQIVNLPDVKNRIQGMSMIPTSNSPEEFQKSVTADIAMWRKVAEENNIK